MLYSGSLLFSHQAPQVEKESAAEGKEEIGDSQEPIRIILYFKQLFVSYGGLKKMYTFSFLLPRYGNYIIDLLPILKSSAIAIFFLVHISHHAGKRLLL